jgi:hypothetical protein
MKSVPIAARPALKALKKLGSDAQKNAPLKVRRKDVELLEEEISRLQKKNKEWAGIVALLATGAVSTAVALAKTRGYTIPQTILAVSEPAGDFLRYSGTKAGQLIVGTATLIGSIFVDGLYRHILSLPVHLAHTYISQLLPHPAQQHQPTPNRKKRRSLHNQAIVENNNNYYHTNVKNTRA